MRKLVLIGVLFLSALSVRAEQTKYVYNPITGRLDLITALSTSSIQAGSNVTVSTTSNGVIISASTSSAGNFIENSATPATSTQVFNVSSGTFVNNMTVLSTTSDNYLQVYSDVLPINLGFGPQLADMVVHGHGAGDSGIGAGLRLVGQDDSSGNQSYIALTGGGAPIIQMEANGAYVTLGGPYGFYMQTPSRIAAAYPLSFYDQDDTNYVSIRSSDTVVSNISFVLPSSDGTNGQAMVTNGSGNLSFATISGGSGSQIYPATSTVGAIFPYGISVRADDSSAAPIDIDLLSSAPSGYGSLTIADFANSSLFTRLSMGIASGAAGYAWLQTNSQALGSPTYDFLINPLGGNVRIGYGTGSSDPSGSKFSIYSDLGAPAQVSGALNAESASGGSYVPGDTCIYQIWAYKTVLGTQIYSPTYSQTNSITLSGAGSAFDVSWTDDTPGGSDGFLIIRDYNSDGFASYYDLGAATSFTDDLDFSLSWTAGTPTTTPNEIGYTHYSYSDGTNFYGVYGGDGYLGKLALNTTLGNEILKVNQPSTSYSALKIIRPQHTATLPSAFSLVDETGTETVGFTTWNGGGSANGGGYSVAKLGSDCNSPGCRFGEISSRDESSGIRTAGIIFEQGSSANSGQIAMITGVGGSFVYGIVLNQLGNTGFKGVTSPTAKVHIAAGTTAANTAPLKFNTGSLMTTAEAGAMEFLTDKPYFTITTNAFRKEMALNDATPTNGQLVYISTNGRNIGTANMSYSTSSATVSFASVTVNGLLSGTTTAISSSATFRGALAIPANTSPTLSSVGNMAVDTSSGQLVYYNGTGEMVLSSTQTKTINISSPTVGDFLMGFATPYDLTITGIVCTSSAATSATITLKDCSRFDGTSCNTIASGVICSTMSTTSYDIAISSDVTRYRRIRPQVTAVSGSPGETSVDIWFREKRR